MKKFLVEWLDHGSSPERWWLFDNRVEALIFAQRLAKECWDEVKDWCVDEAWATSEEWAWKANLYIAYWSYMEDEYYEEADAVAVQEICPDENGILHWSM